TPPLPAPTRPDCTVRSPLRRSSVCSRSRWPCASGGSSPARPTTGRSTRSNTSEARSAAYRIAASTEFPPRCGATGAAVDAHTRSADSTPLHEPGDIAGALSCDHRFVPGEVHYRRGVHTTVAGVDDHVERAPDPVRDVLSTGHRVILPC